MKFTNTIGRTSWILAALIGTLCVSNSAFAQFESADSNTGTNLDIYAGAFAWDNPFGTPSATAPTASDDVVLGNQRNAASAQNYRVDGTAAPQTVATLQIGSLNSDATELTQDVNFQVRDNANFTVTGVATMGVAGGGAYDIIMNDNENNGAGPVATLTLAGGVEIQGTNTNHRIELAANGDTLVIGGDIAANAGAPALNNGSGGTAAWSESVDLVFSREGTLVLNGTNQVFNLDELRVGSVSNNNPLPIDITFDNNVTINADDVFIGRNTDASANNESIVAIANFDSATVVTDDVFVVGGFTSNTNGAGITRTGDGTANFGLASNPGNGSTVFVGNDLIVGQGTGVPVSTDNTATGVVNINDGYVVTVDSQTIVGATPTGTGTINVNNGTLQSNDEIFLGGNVTNNTDDGATGTLNVGPDGVVIVNFPGDTTNRNIEVGRDGDGFLNIDGGSLTNHRGNLVIGQNNANAGAADNARGTVTFTNGADVLIGTQGASNNLNFNSGGGDLTQDGSSAADRTTVTIENNLQMSNSGADTVAANVNSSYTISGFSDLNVNNDFNSRANTVGTNTFTIVDDDVDINITGDLNVNDSSFELVFDFTSDGNIHDFNMDVAGNAAVGGATLTFANSSADLAAFNGDILLVDVVGANAAQFANAVEGQMFGAYMLTYTYDNIGNGPLLGANEDRGTGGGTSIALVRAAIAVPEPSSLIFLAAIGGVLTMRRRRKS